jgi:4-hydroxybutyrate dehydrogenase
MKQFSLVPKIMLFEHSDEFCNHFQIGKQDLIITSHSTYKPYFEGKTGAATIVLRGQYGSGEPTDEMVEAIYQDIKGLSYNRVIAIGGGTVIDMAKLFALETLSPVVDLFERKIDLVKNKELVIVPTTCGTGSEVTNISILELKSKNTKLGLAADELYADYAVMIPELIQDLPFSVFATSSIDALVHACESYLSPKASVISQNFSAQAIQMIIEGYKQITYQGEVARKNILEQFLLASTYAGVAFGNAGCAAVHAMSYPLGAMHHVPHGEANYTAFIEVFKTYQTLKPTGAIQGLNQIIMQCLGCKKENVYSELEVLLNKILVKKPLKAYGVTVQELEVFTSNVMMKQGRLMANNYTILDREQVYQIYKKIF